MSTGLKLQELFEVLVISSRKMTDCTEKVSLLVLMNVYGIKFPEEKLHNIWKPMQILD